MSDSQQESYGIRVGDKGRISCPEDEVVWACPDCDSSDLRYRHGDNRALAPKFPVVCGDCHTGCHLGDLVTRDPKTAHQGQKGPHGMALSELDPDTDLREVSL